jgi:multidrug efflux system outer membrane protein
VTPARHVRRAFAGVALATLAACGGPPAYRPAQVDLPVSWTIEAPWREAAPADSLAKGPWWQRFADPDLEALELRALDANPTLAAATARLAQSRATLAAAGAAEWPQLSLSARLARAKISADRPRTNYASPNFSTLQNDAVVSLAVNYEVDLGGRVRSAVESARISTEQSAADLENTRLILTADLATAYFNLRETDLELDVLARAIELQRRGLDFASSRHDLGAASGIDIAQQQALLDTTLTQAELLRRQRAQFEHAIATLIGAPAPTFTIAATVRRVGVPAIPIGVPSDLLQRRPDVAAAERAMAVANAQIGVARAAFYPSILLTPSYGIDTAKIADIVSYPATVWSLGVSLLQPLFDAGRIQANVDFTQYGYDVTVANYRRIVLTAMQEAEDGITGLAALSRALAQARIAVDSSGRVLELANARYEGGVATYLDVITAQQGLLNNERLATQLEGQQLLTSVFLVKALGGDWTGFTAPQANAR